MDDGKERYSIQRYDGNSTRILCAGGWVVAMIERLANDRWAICVGDQRYTGRTFGSVRAAFKWWEERRARDSDAGSAASLAQ